MGLCVLYCLFMGSYLSALGIIALMTTIDAVLKYKEVQPTPNDELKALSNEVQKIKQQMAFKKLWVLI